MNLSSMFRRSAASFLATVLTTAVSAQVVPGQSGILVSGAPEATARDVRVFDPPSEGHARPPLHVNARQAASTPFAPAQILHAYGFDQLTADGSGQKIGIVDAYGNPDIQTDLDTFCKQFGLTSTTVQVLGTTSRNTGWGLETALDVEWAHVVAPQATIILSVAKSSSYSDLLAAVDAAINAGATVVSMSWGGSESSAELGYDSHFKVSGVTFVASSGDSGESTGVEWPAASPYVVGVGGTSLSLNADNSRSTEVAWSGSGGGLSTVESFPSYQNGWQGWSTQFRGVPDVSYVADPNTGLYVYDALNGGWYEVGGTSVGAPQWAALIALANQNGGSALTSPNGTIYSLAGTPSSPINSSYFFDVMSGNNGSDPDDLASAGYDLVTGVGSPVANSLVPALGGPQSPDFSVSITPSTQTVAPGSNPSYTVTIAYLGGFTETVTLSASGGPNGGTFNPGSVTASGTSTLTFPNVSAGTYTLTITGTSTSGTQHSVTATLIVATADFSISASPSSQSVRAGNSTTYKVTVTPSGGFSGTVTFGASGLPSGANASFKPTSVTGSGSSTMTVTTTRNTPAGSSTLTITGTGPSTSHSITVTLAVSSNRF